MQAFNKPRPFFSVDLNSYFTTRYLRPYICGRCEILQVGVRRDLRNKVEFVSTIENDFQSINMATKPLHTLLFSCLNASYLALADLSNRDLN